MELVHLNDLHLTWHLPSWALGQSFACIVDCFPVHTHVCSCACICIHVRRQRITLGPFPNCAPLLFAPLNMELDDLARWLATKSQESICFCLPSSGDRSLTPCIWLLHGCKRLNSGLHTWVARILLSHLNWTCFWLLKTFVVKWLSLKEYEFWSLPNKFRSCEWINLDKRDGFLDLYWINSTFKNN